ncbi:TonB-dependent receptor [Novosphingobium sp. ZN18A2]|uniref:TonB-dependent receptor n=1 Tax=Novosphingobium sp. ZN18A2 TaxID=3079861 RepID=UPI0030D2DC5F
MTNRHILLAATILSAAPLAATAAQAKDAAAGSSAVEAAQLPPGHDMHGPEIVVTGRVFSPDSDPVMAPVVMKGDELLREVQPQIGDTLAKLPGVSSSSFAPGVSRPVLRGFDGPRVEVLLDGIGSLDASSVSGDHAVALDTLNVERVDVLHGPQALMYSSDPMGGVVNAMDKRIPRRVPENGYKFDGLASYGTAANQAIGAGALDVALAPRFVAHFDASYNHSTDERIGGYVLSPQLRAQTLADAADLAANGDTGGAAALTDAANASGRIANSWANGHTLGAGLAFIDDGGTIGVSVQRLETNYGIPPRPSATPGSNTSIALRQTRFGLRTGVNLDGGFIRKVELNAAYADYDHAELDNGVPATRFLNKAFDTRLVATQARRGGWRGQTGIQYGDGNLAVVGDEKLLPDSNSSRFAAFTLQQYRLARVDLEAALRYEHSNVRAKPAGLTHSFNQVSASAGIGWHVTDELMLNLAGIHGERAPASEELFVDGAHDATQSYEIGNPNFTVEKSNGVEGGLRFRGDGALFAVTAYYTDFDNFITPVPTGAVIEDLPVYQFIQAPARFWGVESEASVTAARWGDNSLKMEAGGDYVNARLKGIGPVPRIPPLRLRGAVQFDMPTLSLRGEVEWNAKQDRVSAKEYPTGAFTLLGASATWRPLGEDSPLTLILSGDNLLNADGRRSASETRDFVPITGRNVKLTLAVSI